MSISSTTGSASINAAALNTTATTSTTASSAAQDRFLTLLVTQLKNQDPLSPMDNAQITSQMAQISTVSGIDQLNTTLQSMATSFSAGQSLQATSMIGHNVLAPASAMTLQDGSAIGGAELSQAADDVVVSIRDSSGLQLHQVHLGAQAAGVMGFQWDGVTDSGATAAAGSYSFTVAATQGGKKVDATTLAGGQVSSVTTGKNGVTLNVNGIGQVTLADVKQVM